MKILWGSKDGGPESKVFCWGFESKRFGSLLLLRFDEGSREVFHSHAFKSISVVLKGGLLEVIREYRGGRLKVVLKNHVPSGLPILTHRHTLHQVFGMAPHSWVVTVRGPWRPEWNEWIPVTDKTVTLTHGRKVVEA